jgi:predicted cupin superfamily sugar epimerase
MHARASALIDQLQLSPHPEGGFYREIHRSSSRVRAEDGRPSRASVTSIYFLLTDGQYSRWHRVQSDELWHFVEGDALDLFLAPPSPTHVDRLAVSSPRAEGRPLHVVPAGWWQAARSTGAYSLVVCTVAPGFEFADFSFLADDPACVEILRGANGDLLTLL